MDVMNEKNGKSWTSRHYLQVFPKKTQVTHFLNSVPRALVPPCGSAVGLGFRLCGMAPSITPSPIRWRSDFDKFVVVANFQRRGWVRWNSENDEPWNVYWANVHTTREIFAPENGIRLGDNQHVNHFPNHYELTRKDLLVKNVKRYRKDLERNAIRIGCDPTTASNDASAAFDFLPPTFVLPGEYALFVEAFRKESKTVVAQGDESNGTKDNGKQTPNERARHRIGSAGGSRMVENNIAKPKTKPKTKHPTWIVKPVGKAQGKGIFLINSLAQVRRWKDAHGLGGGANGIRDEKFVVSKYVDDPYLVGGRKFDLRVYVVVTGFKPLKAWVARAGFARFCVRKYVPVNSGNDGDLNDHFAHLTNVAIQKNHGAYSETHGGKWSLENLRVFLTGTRGLDATNALFTSLNAVILKSLRSVENVMHNDPHSFEVYGYDLLVDENLKPWLIEGTCVRLSQIPARRTCSHTRPAKGRLLPLPIVQNNYSDRPE